VAILVKEKDQSFKTIGIRSLFGHFPAEKSKITPVINQGVQGRAAAISTVGRFYSLFRGYGPEILTPGFLRPWANDAGRKSSSSAASPSSLSFASHSLGGGKAVPITRLVPATGAGG
jgi:hypothetical protein